MKAIDILNVVLRHTVDAPYTVTKTEPITDATIVIFGHFNIDEGAIEDQLRIGLWTYFSIKDVTVSVRPEADGWLKYQARLTRRPAFARVPMEVTR